MEGTAGIDRAREGSASDLTCSICLRFPYACIVPGLSNRLNKTHWLEQRRCPEEERHESCEGNSPCDWPAIANGCLKAELHSPRIPKSRAPKRMAHTSSGPCAHSESRARSESNPNSPTRTQSPRKCGQRPPSSRSTGQLFDHNRLQ